MRVRFCNIKKGQYQAKMLELLQSDQFEPMINTDDSVVLKIEKVIKKELMNLKKKQWYKQTTVHQIEINR